MGSLACSTPRIDSELTVNITHGLVYYSTMLLIRYKVLYLGSYRFRGFHSRFFVLCLLASSCNGRGISWNSHNTWTYGFRFCRGYLRLGQMALIDEQACGGGTSGFGVEIIVSMRFVLPRADGLQKYCNKSVFRIREIHEKTLNPKYRVSSMSPKMDTEYIYI